METGGARVLVAAEDVVPDSEEVAVEDVVPDMEEALDSVIASDSVDLLQSVEALDSVMQLTRHVLFIGKKYEHIHTTYTRQVVIIEKKNNHIHAIVTTWTRHVLAIRNKNKVFCKPYQADFVENLNQQHRTRLVACSNQTLSIKKEK